MFTALFICVIFPALSVALVANVKPATVKA